MSVPANIVGEMCHRLERIERLAKEVKAIPNFGPDVGTRKEGDRKCRQICDDAGWIEQMVRSYFGIGTGGISGELSGPCGRVG